MESLVEYVMVSQDRVSVERYRRRGEFWEYTAETSLDAAVELVSVGCTLPLREVYARTRFVQQDAPGTPD